MNFKKIYFISAFLILFFVFFPVNIQAKDLIYEAHLGKGEDGQKYMTFRKYVRHYGKSVNTDWEEPNTLLSSQVSNADGSYVTNAMVFHKNYGTNYISPSNTTGNTVIKVGYDYSASSDNRIKTDGDRYSDIWNFFNAYNIQTQETKIELHQSSNKYGSMGNYLESDLIVSKEKIFEDIAITDFKAEGETFKNIVNKVKENITKEGNWYKTRISGKITIKSYESSRKFDICTAQEMIDVMLPENQAYYNNGSTINSNWSGNDFGYDQNGPGRNLKVGYSVLNNFDNWLWISELGMNGDSKEVYVNHFDLNGNQLWWAENPTQELLDKNGSKIQDISNNTGNKNNQGGNWQEAYEILNTQKLRVRNSDVIRANKYDNKEYDYIGYNRRSYNENWVLDSSKNKSGGPSETSYTVDESDSKITTIDFFYKLRSEVKKRKIYVNHLSTDGTTRLEELSNDSQILVPDYTNVPNMASFSDSKGYMEYYEIDAEKYMLLKPSTKLNANNRVKINGKWYKYAYYNTRSGSTFEEVSNYGISLTKQSGKQYRINHTNPITFVTFYYEPVNSGGSGDDDGDIDGEYNTKILGKLAFTSEYNLTGNNSEFVPVKSNLYPYIEGAQKYILPNINENSTNKTERGDVIDKSGKNRSYWDDYDEYRNVTIKGISKGGDYDGNHTIEYAYNNQYTASSTIASGNQPLKVYNGNNKNRITIAGEDIVLADYAKEEGKEQTITINGREDGYVKYTTNYTQTGSRTVGEGENAKTIYSYRYETKYIDPFTGNTVTSSRGTGSGASVPHDYVVYSKQSVPVTYSITLKKKWKLSHLYLYIIEDNTPTIQVINGSSNKSDEKGGVYQNGDNNIKLELTNSYYNSLKNKLKTYYQDYNDTRRKIDSAIQGSKLLTNSSDFKEKDSKYSNRYIVGNDKYNGIRKAVAEIQYKYYDLAEDRNIGSGKLNHTYDNIDKDSGNERINIYTPLVINEPEISSTQSVVNQTGDEKYNNAIQRNVPFTFTPKVNDKVTYGKGEVNSNNYLSEYYVKFDFNLNNIKGECKYIDSLGNRRSVSGNIEAGTYIIIPKGGSITATAYDIDVGQTNNKIRVFASTINKINNEFVDKQIYSTGKNFYSINTVNKCIDRTSIVKRGGTRMANENTTYNGSSSTMFLDARYIIYRDASTSNVGRIFEFKVTDCTDLGYKEVFRSTNENKVNNTNEESYFYSGKFYWFSGINNLIPRKDDDNILPLGPYKNSKDKTYIYAPKLGYRFSFDLKTTGFLNNNTKSVEITPTYYYISKDGSKYLGDNEITLYYKTSSGKYKKYKDSNYYIQFKPNDGYRALADEHEKTNLSDKFVNLNISKTFTLSNKSMMTKSKDGYTQCWYGEFKLPNSTIVVKNDGGNINNPLNDGYIGVKFKIDAKEKDDNGNYRIISYNNKDIGTGNGSNSTQWDYEGYLGYNYNVKQGADVNSGDVKAMQLEKGIWNINDQGTYEKVKGTVILYDIDSRAANDFN